MKKCFVIILVFVQVLSLVASAQQATATLTVTVTIPSICKIKAVSHVGTNADLQAVDFFCNVRESGQISLENSVLGFLSWMPDCQSGQTTLQVPVQTHQLSTRRIYLCGVQDGESPLVTFSP